MKASATLLLGALAAIANAVQFTVNNWNVQAGQPFTISWSDANGPVTIYLKNGNSGDLKTVQTITTGATGTSFVWTPSSSLPSDTYALEITDSSGTPNYGSQFTFAGSGTPSATTSTASSTSASSSSSTSATTTSAPITTMSASNSTTTATTRTPLSNSTTLTTTTSRSSSASSTGSSSSSAASTTSTKVPNTSDSHRVASSLALILGAVAAFVAFN